MFADYKAQVMLAYKEKRMTNALSLNLALSTPAKLRAECLIAFNNRYLKKDENILKVFFNLKNDAANYEQVIKRFEADKFKPLDNYLKGITSDTDDKNIELLAWLIDFEPRPYKFGQTITAANIHSEHATETRNSIADNVSPFIEKTVLPGKRSPALNIRNGVILLVVVITGAGMFFFRNNLIRIMLPEPLLTGKEECMYWADDHFKPVSCRKKLGDTLITALDKSRMSRFKKITDPDTITINSLRKIWYVKINDHIEFYTSAGFHPVHPEKRLKPLTKYILNKYGHQN